MSIPLVSFLFYIKNTFYKKKLRLKTTQAETRKEMCIFFILKMKWRAVIKVNMTKEQALFHIYLIGR